jgi:hypothetical protein
MAWTIATITGTVLMLTDFYLDVVILRTDTENGNMFFGDRSAEVG